MPLTTPPVLSVPLYARDPISGDTFLVRSQMRGPTGPTGPQGVATIIVAGFGPDLGGSGTSATLPADGLLPLGFCASGSPQYQMEVGQSLYYESTGAPDDGFLYQFLSDIAGAPWMSLGRIQGPQGDVGPTGPTGNTGPQGDDIFVGPDDPSTIKPTTELWYDTDDDRILGPTDMPLGGLPGQFLIKKTDLDNEVEWTGANNRSAFVGDNAGYFMAGNGGIFKKSGAGWVLRKSSGNAAIPIENNDGTGGTNIITANGAVEMTAPLKWGNVEGDKLYLYPGATPGTNSFGLGIAASTTVIFVGSAGNKVAFRIGGHDGTEYASFTNTLTTIPPLAASSSNVSWLNSFTGTCDFRWNAAAVTLRMRDVRHSGKIDQSATLKMFTLPAGVPLPAGKFFRSDVIMSYSNDAYYTPPTDWRGFLFIDVRDDGVWVQVLDECAWHDGHNVSTTITWTR